MHANKDNKASALRSCMAGTETAEQAAVVPLVVKYAVDGELAWRHESTGDVVVREHKAWTVVVVRSDAVVVAAGDVVDDETGLDRWVVAYAP